MKTQKGQKTKTAAGKPDAQTQKAAVKHHHEEDRTTNLFDMQTVSVKPPEQLALTDKELETEHTRVLSAKDPVAPKNLVRFSFKERVYKLDAAVEQCALHFEMEGNLMHRESEEGKRIQAEIEAERIARERAAEAESMTVSTGENHPAAESVNEHKKLRNQFNYSERASQTFNNPLRERPTITEPPPSVGFNSMVTQWEIFDAFMEDIEKQRISKEKSSQQAQKKPAASSGEKEEEEETQKEVAKEGDIVHSSAMSKTLKVMERMVNQNTYDDVAQDYKYWDDASDQFKEGEGTLLPLWKFWTDKVRRKHVTALCWNPEYYDLFAAGYGSYDFMKQGSGVVCCFSLKNPSHPEYSFTTETGVMCLDFHPQHASLLAVGCYDGTVMIFDIRNKLNKPIFQSTVKTGKHTDPVWQVRWQEEDLAKNLNFFSISSDGRVTLWTMSKNELQFTDVMELKLTGIANNGAEEAGEETSLVGLAGGVCFDFHKTSEHLFIVGTEEGKIHKCSKAYNSQYLDTYNGHYMSVYSVKWNNFHPTVFLSASADWTVKLWDHTQKQPIMSFDLGNAVGGVSWSPYSSSVFAAVTNDGKVHVFDLAENKHEPMCDQKVVRKSKLTQVVFNPKQPLLLVGDDRGGVLCLKLSPNLRKTEEIRQKDKEAAAASGGDTAVKKPPIKKRGAEADAAPAEQEAQTPKDKEIQKLDKILGLGDKGSRS